MSVQLGNLSKSLESQVQPVTSPQCSGRFLVLTCWDSRVAGPTGYRSEGAGRFLVLTCWESRFAGPTGYSFTSVRGVFWYIQLRFCSMQVQPVIVLPVFGEIFWYNQLRFYSLQVQLVTCSPMSGRFLGITCWDPRICSPTGYMSTSPVSLY